MKKLFLLLLSAFDTGINGRRKAVTISFLAFILGFANYSAQAQVTVTQATGGTTICYTSAIGGKTPGCTTLGDIIITEGAPTDFAAGTDVLSLQLPSGWQYCVPPTATITATAGDIAAITYSVTTTGSGGIMTITFTTTGTTNADVVTIHGLKVQPTTPLFASVTNGPICASSVTGITGIVPCGPGGTDFGDLVMIPGAITGFSAICVGETETYTGGIPGGTWSIIPTTIATVTLTGDVTGIKAGTAKLVYTIAGCSDTFNLTVNKTPGKILVSTTHLPIGDQCAWVPAFWVYDVDSTPGGGIFTSGAISGGPGTTVTASLFTGHGFVEIHGPGVGYVKFQLGTCSMADTFNIWPLPAVITGNDTICQNDTTTLSNSYPGGTWSTSSTIISVDPATGFVTGLHAGTAIVTFTTPHGCTTDTVITVNPLPSPIAGTPFACMGMTTVLTDTMTTSTWSATNANVTLAPTFGNTTVVTGSLTIIPGTGGLDTIINVSLHGCADSFVVTVNPVPAGIAGSSNTECKGDSTIAVSETSTGGTWSSSNTGIATIDTFTGKVYGVNAGVDTIFYSYSTGCNQMYIVTINPLPGAISGRDTVCADTTTFISLSVGLPSSPPFSPCPWTSSAPGIARVDCAGTYDGLSPGTATITYTLATGCYSTYTLTVDPIPTPITGASVICITSSTTLSDGAVGGIWTSSNTGVATIDSFTGLVNGIGLGTSTISYTLPTGGCNRSFVITVTPFPSSVPYDTICMSTPGVTINDTLNNTPTGGTWSTSNTNITLGSTTGIVSGIIPGTAIVTYTLGAAACQAYDTVLIDSAGILVGGISPVCVGQNFAMLDTLLGDTLLGTWSTTNPLIDTVSAGGGVYTYGVGTDSIIFKTLNGCISIFSITINPSATISAQITDTLCFGLTDTLWTSIKGGTWSVDDPTQATITKLPSSGLGDSAVLIPLTSSTRTVFYTLASSGCVTPFSITINPSPTGIISGAVCQYDSLLITDTSSSTIAGGWSNVYSTIGTINSISGLYHGLSPGLDTVHYTSTKGGCVVSDTVRVYPVKKITGTDTLCVGTTVTLSDTLTGGTWSSVSTTISIGSSTGVVTGIDSGVAVVTYTLPTGCLVFYDLTIYPLPLITSLVDSTCVGSPVTFTASPPGGSWSSSNLSVATVNSSTGVVMGIANGTATITYTTPHGCVVTASVLVHGVPPNITGLFDICLGDSTILSDGTPGGLWSISSTTVATIDTILGTVHTFTIGTDSVYYTVPSTGCGAFVVITVHALPSILLASDPPGFICRGGTDTLFASTPGDASSHYVWSPTYALSSTGTPEVIVSPTVTTVYTVIATDAFGCRDTAMDTVMVDTLLNHLKVVGIDTICAGDSTIIMASGRDLTLFAWTPTAGLICTICDTTHASPPVTTLYEATAIDRHGCKDSIPFNLTVIPPPNLRVFSAPDHFPIILCRGTPLQLYAFGAYTYVWSPNLFLSCDSCSNPVVTDTFNMVYRLTGYTSFGCPDSLNVKISVLDTNVNFVVGDTAICKGDTARLFASSHSTYSNLDIPTFSWSPSTGLDTVAGTHVIANPEATTVYTLVITENACFSDTALVTVNVEPYPIISLTPKAEDVFTGTSVQAVTTVTNTPVKSYVWTPPNTVSCDTCANTLLTPTGSITAYTVTVTSIYGCTSFDTVTIAIGCNSQQIFIPNVFTPNGDGMNDRFYVSGKGIKTITLFEIYNRWGQLIYHMENINANDASMGWDGTFKGKVLEPDVFMYKVQATCELGGVPFKYQGDISLVR